MTSHRYADIAADLRRRIKTGEWEVGQRIPGISDLQKEYDVRSLNVIRRAQAVLVQEGLLRTAQGRGAFVMSLGAPSVAESLADLERAGEQLATALQNYTAVVARTLREALSQGESSTGR